MNLESYITNPQLDFTTGEVILIDKPLTWTSFNAVSKIKHAIKNHPSLIKDGLKLKSRVGHAGTLDPLATGLLIICTGKKTKEIENYQGMKKVYMGIFFLGVIILCFDLEKEVDATYPTEHITKELLYKTAQSFVGVKEQTPPIFSAIKIKGKRAYNIAREGKEVELKSRSIEIESFEITTIEMPHVSFKIICSKGTYIRSIARDFGIALTSGAHLISLRREKIGEFDVKNAISL